MAVQKKAKKKAKKSTAKKKTAAKRASGQADGAKPAGGASGEGASIRINLGHIFELRPRVNTSFRPGDLNTAKHFLRDESYASLEEAARAVATKALELSHKGAAPKAPRRR
jgi:hypothetical protein